MSVDKDDIVAAAKHLRTKGKYLPKPEQAAGELRKLVMLFGKKNYSQKQFLELATEALALIERENGAREAATAAVVRAPGPSVRPQQPQARVAALGPARSGNFPAPSAPFRFVTLPDQVAMPEAGVETSLDKPKPDGFSAVIDVEWVAEGPILIGQENKDTHCIEPMTLGSGFIIPGASLRGMIRSAVEIVAHGRLGSVNLENHYGLRDLDHASYGASPGASVTKAGDIKAAWLTLVRDVDKGTFWRFTPCKHGYVKIADMLAGNTNWGSSNRKDWMMKSLVEKYTASGSYDAGTRTFTYQTAGSFTYDKNDNGREIFKIGGNTSGKYVFSNAVTDVSSNKQHEYFFHGPFGTVFELPEQHIAIDRFIRINSVYGRGGMLEPEGSWADVHATFRAGRSIPIFYVGSPPSPEHSEDAGNFAFGLTRLFKIPHKRSVKDVVAGEQAQHFIRGSIKRYAPDFTENLFGYVFDPTQQGEANDDRSDPGAFARKGRISFGFARVAPSQDVKISDAIPTIMMAPRSSFAPFYLRSSHEPDYSAAQAPRIAGRKRYVPRWTTQEAENAIMTIKALGATQIAAAKALAANGTVSDNVTSKLRFLVPSKGYETRFTSRIKLHNVTAAELGAVLFALTHGGDPAKPYRHMLGRGKGFGGGQLRVDTARLAVEAHAGTSDLIKPPSDEEQQKTDQKTGFCPAVVTETAGNASHRPFLDAFVAAMKKVPSLQNYPNLPVIKEFLGISDPTLGSRMARRGTLKYMELDDFKKLKDATKPKKLDKGSQTPPGIAKLSGATDDGRTLPAPLSERRLFWT